ncbi:hypothetical protein Pcar_3295 [Syntrophotalea carbinolica DSM 2380]|uniref:Uncharacterized protein n=1 Tax=Syntrophotalea carbinolica (strain DSM 2380 / NBRC 103641 / GraBd1) TaxID=338963 RepID=Q0C6M3_SYNC1|nr:hypothetical protein Pcar_3295 [Syntrophotalea carbinolica DSM 2380]
MRHQDPPKRITITRENLSNWSTFQKLYDEGKVLFDNMGTLRYLHGAPVGDMVLVRVNRDGKAVYKESAENWFDPDSPAAEKFVWPK